jgi:hypothetical protein
MIVRIQITFPFARGPFTVRRDDVPAVGLFRTSIALRRLFGLDCGVVDESFQNAAANRL